MVARDWVGVHGLLAPWIQNSPSVHDVRMFHEDAYLEVLPESGAERMHHPETFLIGGNSEVTAKELYSPVGSWSDYLKRLSPPAADENLRIDCGYCSDEQADELEFDELPDVLMAVIGTDRAFTMRY